MKVYAFLADGFETVEALGVIDMLRRAKVDVVTVSITDKKEVVSSHRIPVIADMIFSETDFSDGDMLFLPGGLPGTTNLEACGELIDLINEYYKTDRYIAAICAAPSILGHMGLLNGKKATCYPGYEKDLTKAEVTGEGVTVDGKILTAKGMGKTIDLGLAILDITSGEETKTRIGKAIQYLA